MLKFSQLYEEINTKNKQQEIIQCEYCGIIFIHGGPCLRVAKISLVHGKQFRCNQVNFNIMVSKFQKHACINMINTLVRIVNLWASVTHKPTKATNNNHCPKRTMMIS